MLVSAVCQHCGQAYQVERYKARIRKYCSPACGCAARTGHPRVAVSERFWAKVDKTGECWEWKGYRTSDGYGRFMLGGKSRHAPRVAYELAFSPLPEGTLVCHRCDNPGCVRPEHLFEGTQQDNMRDMASKGRGARLGGARNPRAKLDWAQVGQIRERYAQGGITQSALARLYGVSAAAIRFIVTGRTW